MKSVVIQACVLNDGLAAWHYAVHSTPPPSCDWGQKSTSNIVTITGTISLIMHFGMTRWPVLLKMIQCVLGHLELTWRQEQHRWGPQIWGVSSILFKIACCANLFELAIHIEIPKHCYARSIAGNIGNTWRKEMALKSYLSLEKIGSSCCFEFSVWVEIKVKG